MIIFTVLLTASVVFAIIALWRALELNPFNGQPDVEKINRQTKRLCLYALIPLCSAFAYAASIRNEPSPEVKSIVSFGYTTNGSGIYVVEFCPEQLIIKDGYYYIDNGPKQSPTKLVPITELPPLIEKEL